MSALAIAGIATGATLSMLGGATFFHSHTMPDKKQRRTSSVIGLTFAGLGAVLSALSAVELRNEKPKPRARRNPSKAKAAFKAFHWGDESENDTEFEEPATDELFKLGDLVRVDYETHKGGKRAIWFHEFDDPFPILTATSDGELGPILGGDAIVTSAGIEG